MTTGSNGLIAVVFPQRTLSCNIDDRRIDNVPVAQLKSLGRQVPLFKQSPAQIVLLKQMAETAHRRLVGYRFAAEIDPDEITHRHRIVERLLHRRVRQVEPVLQEIDAQRPLDPRAAIAWLRIERLNQRAQRRPRHNRCISARNTPGRVVLA